jgi:hypothetical protein
MIRSLTLGEVCEHGQHDNCAAVGDPYDEDILVRDGRAVVWVCGCRCYGEFLTQLME